jgi:beta-lactamase regulating signal transducer with metallopeptidase domain
MTISTTYLLNVALHAAILSVFATFALLVMRQARHRSVTAIVGLLAAGFLPWLTALRPARPVAAPVAEIQTQSPSLPTWTVVTLPMERDNTPKPAERSVAPPKFGFPDPLTATVMTWAAGSGTGIFLLVCAMLRLRIWRKSLSPPDDAAWETLRSLSPEIPERHHFLISQATASPCVTGLYQPRIVLPRFLLSSASEEELRWAVRHEIAHWQAGDSRWMILFSLIRGVNWWNPFVHLLISRWADAREQLCDLHAAGASESRADYGEFLVAMAGKISKQPPLAVAMSKRLHAKRLKRRITSLLVSTAESQTTAGKRFSALTSVVFIACATLISSVKIDAEEPVEKSTAIPRFPILEPPIPKTSTATSLATPPSVQNELPVPPEQKKRQVNISTKFIISDFAPGFDAEQVPHGGRFDLRSVFSAGQMKMIMRGFAQTKGTNLLTAPSMTALSGQTGTIELIDRVFGTPEQIAERGPDAKTPFVGISFTPVIRFSDELPPREPAPAGALEPVTSAGSLELSLDLDYRFVPGVYPLGSNRELASGLDPDRIKVFKRSIKGMLFSGYTVGLCLGEVEPGKYLSVFTQVDAIDSTGRPIDMQKLADELQNRESIIVDRRRADEGTLPLPEIRGSLRLNAALVEIPLKKPRPPGEGLVIGLTPTIKSVADRFLTTPEGKFRNLKTIDIPLNQRSTPWPEFPQLSLTVMASKNHQVISLTSHAVGSGEEEFPNTWEQAPGDIMNFGIRTADTSIERRLLITIEGVK